MKFNTLGVRIASGFVCILLILMVAILISIFSIQSVNKISTKIQTKQAPIVIASMEVLNGVNSSLAALRGWMILGDKQFNLQREKSWAIIDANKTKLDHYTRNMKDSKHVKQLNSLAIMLDKFKIYQVEIEQIAHDKKNIKGLQILFNQAEPLGDKIITNITKLIDLEKKQLASPQRKQLLSYMADFRGSMGMVLANVRAFLLSGDEAYAVKLGDYWRINTKSFQKVQIKEHLLTGLQKRFFDDLIYYRDTFTPLPNAMLKMRRSNDWNQANFLLKTKAVPTAREITKILRDLSIEQQHSMSQAFTLQEHQLVTLIQLEWILLFFGILASALLAYLITRSVTKPIKAAIEVANKISKGDYSMKKKINGFVEAEALGTAFTQMNAQVEDQINTRTKTLEYQSWLKENVASISENISQLSSSKELAEYVLTCLAEALKAHCAVFYIHEKVLENDAMFELSLLAAYGYKKRKNINTKIQLDDGLLGQCAKEKKAIIMTDVPKDYISINSGLGEETPKNIYLMPVLFNDIVLAVIEIASFSYFKPMQIDFLEQISKTIGINLYNIYNVEASKKALQRSKELSEELLAQQEELRASNEELEEKTKILVESEGELKTQSEELQASNEELEEKSNFLQEQKQEIENKNQSLEVAKGEIEAKARELEKTGTYKSEFLANMSHELRTPLNSLLILSKSLADNDEGNLTKEQVEESNIIYHGGQELLILINDILDLSKVEAGKMELLLEDVKIKNIATDVQLQFKPISESKNIHFKAEFSKSLPKSMRIDEQKVSQVLKNLLSNAFKFTKKGSVKLLIHRPDAKEVFTRDTLTKGDVVAFSVIDTGVGIPADKQADIFEAFQQADGSTSREYGGTGLGLTISRQLAFLMGGLIQLKSEEGKGSTFTLYLPIDGIENNAQKSPDQDRIAEPKEAPLSEKEKIVAPVEEAAWIDDDRDAVKPDANSLLIIEDDEAFATILLKEGRNQGFLCILSRSGNGGLHLAMQYQPKAIVLDLGLPDMRGELVLQKLKQHLKTRHIPVHIVSASDKNTSLMEAGAIGFLQKPASNKDLKQTFNHIENLLDKKIKKLLIVEDDKSSQVAIRKLVQSKQVSILMANDGKSAHEKILKEDIDCIVLDLNLPDITGFELLKNLSKEPITLPPVIVYTGKELTDKEYAELRGFTSSIVVKGADSPERLLDEVSLFLHSIDAKLPKAQHEMIKRLHAPEEVLEGRQILLVDDDMRNLFALKKVLKKHGLLVEVAKDGQCALNVLSEKEGIDLVIMDIMMPVMDGYTAIEKIRAQTHLRNLPIIALTAKAMPEDKQKCINVGASDYLAKPVDVDRLLSLMRIWLGKT
jgi:CheY-like chemotaxis protein/signal transduction histidine kinase/CHASE3 domain sensor protein